MGKKRTLTSPLCCTILTHMICANCKWKVCANHWYDSCGTHETTCTNGYCTQITLDRYHIPTIKGRLNSGKCIQCESEEFESYPVAVE